MSPGVSVLLSGFGLVEFLSQTVLERFLSNLVRLKSGLELHIGMFRVLRISEVALHQSSESLLKF